MEAQESKDKINPSHYKSHPSGIECIEITRHHSFNIGNAIKYLWRAGLKEGNPTVQDLEKAIWYIQDEINQSVVNEDLRTAVAKGMINKDDSETLATTDTPVPRGIYKDVIVYEESGVVPKKSLDSLLNTEEKNRVASVQASIENTIDERFLGKRISKKLINSLKESIAAILEKNSKNLVEIKIELEREQQEQPIELVFNQKPIQTPIQIEPEPMGGRIEGEDDLATLAEQEQPVCCINCKYINYYNKPSGKRYPYCIKNPTVPKKGSAISEWNKWIHTNKIVAPLISSCELFEKVKENI